VAQANDKIGPCTAAAAAGMSAHVYRFRRLTIQSFVNWRRAIRVIYAMVGRNIAALTAPLYRSAQGEEGSLKVRPPRRRWTMRNETNANHAGNDPDPATKSVAVAKYQSVPDAVELRDSAD
jgi:hypothetical protein